MLRSNPILSFQIKKLKLIIENTKDHALYIKKRYDYYFKWNKVKGSKKYELPVNKIVMVMSSTA